ncbi:MAG: hypothetical protein SVY10_21105 [Thermodesulfobacteriota bacterium]|nr:hypothetical protein [Thermodesulfobacteriota bacterium]
MMYINQNNGTARVDLLGDLNKSNILPIKEDILQMMRSDIEAVEFNFAKVENMDAPAMAIIVIVVKQLLNKKISSRVKGLTKECNELANFLGLHMIADVEREV